MRRVRHTLLLLTCSKTHLERSLTKTIDLSPLATGEHLIKRLPALMIRWQIAEIGELAPNGILSTPDQTKELNEFHNILSLYISLFLHFVSCCEAALRPSWNSSSVALCWLGERGAGFFVNRT